MFINDKPRINNKFRSNLFQELDKYLINKNQQSININQTINISPLN